MTAREWIVIAVCAVTIFNGWLAFWLRRLLKSVDENTAAIAIIQQQLGLYVRREAHDVANAELAAHMDRMRIEANEREGRILGAIDRAANANREDIGSVRSEISNVNGRIDRLRDSNPRRP